MDVQFWGIWAAQGSKDPSANFSDFMTPSLPHWHLTSLTKLGSVAGPVIQANGRLTFEDDLRSGGLLCFISINASVCTELANSMVTPGEPGGD